MSNEKESRQGRNQAGHLHASGGKSVGTWEPSSQKVFQFGRKKIKIWTYALYLSSLLIYFNSESRVSANLLTLSFYAA